MARVVRPKALRHAAAVADRAVESGSHPCAVLAAAGADGIFWSHVAAGADRPAQDSIFLLASITKPIMATAALQMVERGRLLLNAPVASVVEEFAANGKAWATTRHLLTHTSGIDESAWIEDRMNGGAGGPTCLGMACSAHLRFAAGTRCEYCSLSFAAVAGVVERLAGEPYVAHLNAAVLQPAGMADTDFRPADPSRAMPVHDFGGDAALEVFTRRRIAGGGLWSTAADLVRFGQAFLRAGRGEPGAILGQAAVRSMTTLQTAGIPPLAPGAPAFDYALGWCKPSVADDVTCSTSAYGHGGATGTLLWIDPGFDLVFVFLTNRWGIEQDTPRRALNAVHAALALEVTQ